MCSSDLIFYAAMRNPREEAKTQQNTDEDPTEEHAIQQAPAKGLTKRVHCLSAKTCIETLIT